MRYALHSPPGLDRASVSNAQGTLDARARERPPHRGGRCRRHPFAGRVLNPLYAIYDFDACGVVRIEPRLVQPIDGVDHRLPGPRSRRNTGFRQFFGRRSSAKEIP